jgi:N-formylglutamate amidohydrolase
LLPATGNLPVLLSVPHSGTDYPEWLIRDARRGRESLELLEDPLVDRLVWRAIALGCGAVIAQAPRAAVDCNRSPREIDPATTGIAPGGDPGPRARGGLGIVPTRTPRDGELWRRRVSREDTERRISEAWRPYHSALRSELEQLQRRHAEVLLLDCHSMPPRGTNQPQVVIGDRHGKSAGRWLGDLARRTVEAEGFTVAFNDPYAGGWIIDSLGEPRNGVHALQIELDRGLYLDSRARQAGQGFDRVSRLLEGLARALGDAILSRHALPDAAE